MPTMELLRERYDYHPDGYLIARERLSGRCPKGKRIGCPNKGGYLLHTIRGKTYYVHRLIYIYHYGEIEHQIDHINRDKTDNKIENLRDIPQNENLSNRRGWKAPPDEQKRMRREQNRRYYEKRIKGN